MKKTHIAIALLLVTTLAACNKKEPVKADAEAPATSPAFNSPVADTAPVQPKATSPATPAEPTEEQRMRAVKQGKLDYTVMEDGYLNDAHGQWAQSAKASSTFGDESGKTPSESSLPANVAGAPDGKSWTNNHADMGFDWIEATYAKPTAATAVRIVANTNAVKSINKIELLDTAGNWNTVWTGLSDAEQEQRGPRNWFVKTFAKTSYQAKAVKVTFANNVESGYKEVDAIQLIGE